MMESKSATSWCPDLPTHGTEKANNVMVLLSNDLVFENKMRLCRLIQTGGGSHQ